MFFHYIKKEDAKNLAKTQRVNSLIVIVANIITLGMFNFLIFPKLTELFVEANYVLPFYVKYHVHISLIIIALTILLISDSSYLEEELGKKLRKYKKGEMILITKLWNKKYQWRVMGGLGLVMLYLIGAIIVPIYQITSGI
jgi:type II secretory pathway component PulF